MRAYFAVECWPLKREQEEGGTQNTWKLPFSTDVSTPWKDIGRLGKHKSRGVPYISLSKRILWPDRSSDRPEGLTHSPRGIRGVLKSLRTQETVWSKDTLSRCKMFAPATQDDSWSLEFRCWKHSCTSKYSSPQQGGSSDFSSCPVVFELFFCRSFSQEPLSASPSGTWRWQPVFFASASKSMADISYTVRCFR